MQEKIIELWDGALGQNPGASYEALKELKSLSDSDEDFKKIALDFCQKILLDGYYPGKIEDWIKTSNSVELEFETTRLAVFIDIVISLQDEMILEKLKEFDLPDWPKEKLN